MSYVKYRLQALNAENGGFQFEPLATDLLHATYASNIVPASGPVGRGDRGEDARTHATYVLESNDQFRIYTAGPAANKRIFFAYSIEVKWQAKLKSDVESIIDNGLAPEKVVFVTNQIIPTRRRQDAEEALSKEHGIEVEILDGNWLAIHLESEHYSLAVKYLGCDRGTDPRAQEMIERVLDLRVGGMSAEDAAEIERLEDAVRYRAKYEGRPELLVLDLKRLGDILSAYTDHYDASLKWYDEAIRESESISDRITAADVYHSFFHALFKTADGKASILKRLPELTKLVQDNDIVDYLERPLTWLLFLLPHYDREEIDKEEFEKLWKEYEEFLTSYDTSDRSDYVDARLREFRMFMRLIPDVMQGTGPSGALEEISVLLDDAADIDIFPASRLCELLSMMSAFFEGAEYEAVYTKAENLAAARESGFRIAELRRNRANTHVARGEWAKAVYHLNVVKALWRKQETLRGSLLTGLMLARCYRELKLFHAAKYEIAQCVHLATLLPEDRELDLVGAAYAELYTTALMLGYVATAVEAGLWYLKASYLWGADEEEARASFAEVYEDNLIVILPRLLVQNRSLHDALVGTVEAIDSPMLDLYKPTFLTEDDEFEKEAIKNPDLQQMRDMRRMVFDGELVPLETPVIDELNSRELVFECAGVEFRIEYGDDYDLRLVAETVAAWICFLLLSNPELMADLAWIEDKVEIVIERLTEEGNYKVTHIPDNYRLRTRLALSREAGRSFHEPPFENVFEVCLALFTQVLDWCTMAPGDEVFSIVTSLGESGDFDRWTKQAPYAWSVHKFLPRVGSLEEKLAEEEAEKTEQAKAT